MSFLDSDEGLGAFALVGIRDRDNAGFKYGRVLY
jgi:hypothetical protein